VYYQTRNTNKPGNNAIQSNTKQNLNQTIKQGNEGYHIIYVNTRTFCIKPASTIEIKQQPICGEVGWSKGGRLNMNSEELDEDEDEDEGVTERKV
jgi:hypothetical protein